MGRWVSPRVVALAGVCVLGVLLVQGALHPARGVRADVASASPSSASAVVAAASATTPASLVTNTTTDPVNVRAAPTTESAILVQIAAGDQAMLIETNVPGVEGGTTWTRVVYAGRTGYVRADLVSVPRMAVPIMAPTATRLPVGSAPGATATAPLPRTATVMVPAEATPTTASGTVVPLSPVPAASPTETTSATSTPATTTPGA